MRLFYTLAFFIDSGRASVASKNFAVRCEKFYTFAVRFLKETEPDRCCRKEVGSVVVLFTG